MEYAGFWRRFVALMIDGMFGAVCGALLYFVMGNTWSGGIIFGILYEPFFESSVLQGTPGKAFMNMRVTDLQGNRISFKAAFIRYVMRLVSSMFLLLGFLIQPFTEKKQTLHDLVANTLVVRGEIQNVNFFQAWYQQVQEVLGMVDKVPNGKAASYQAPLKTEATPADLAALYDLFQKGILTEAEYNQKREELLKRI